MTGVCAIGDIFVRSVRGGVCAIGDIFVRSVRGGVCAIGESGRSGVRVYLCLDEGFFCFPFFFFVIYIVG